MSENILEINSLQDFLSLNEREGGIYIPDKGDREIHINCRIALFDLDLSELTLYNMVFKEEFVLSGCRIEKKAMLSNCKFEKRAIFGSIFKKGWWCGSLTFHGYVNFIGAKFKDRFEAHDLDVKGRVHFTQATFDSIYLSTSRFLDFVSFREAKVNYFFLQDISFEDAVSLECTTVDGGSREAMRFLKDQAQKNNNKIEAIDFYQKEMLALEADLKEQKGNKSERFILFLNKISNNHGVSWLRGISFTLGTAVIFFTLFILFLEKPYYTFEWKGFNAFISVHAATFRYFLDFINPTHKMSFMDQYLPNGWSFLFDFLGRVFVGYGIYQTLSSFRKYGFK
jgi:hypothetical protein